MSVKFTTNRLYIISTVFGHSPDVLDSFGYWFWVVAGVGDVTSNAAVVVRMSAIYEVVEGEARDKANF